MELAAKLGDAYAEAKFGFINNGREPVMIDAVKSSCGCTTTRLAKQTIGPGERGEVSARFEFGQRRGVQTKTISVSVKGEERPTVLTLVVAIPDLVRIDPGIVIWEKGATAETREIVLTAMPGLPTRVTGVVSSDSRIQATVETIKESSEYVLKITPKTTELPVFAILNIQSEWQGQKKVFPAYAQIRRPVQR